MCYSALYDILRFFKVQGFALAHEVEVGYGHTDSHVTSNSF